MTHNLQQDPGPLHRLFFCFSDVNHSSTVEVLVLKGDHVTGGGLWRSKETRETSTLKKLLTKK